MKTLSLEIKSFQYAGQAQGSDSDLGKRRPTMRRGTNSNGPGGLNRRVLRLFMFGALAAVLVLAPGTQRADAQVHGRGGHFGGWGARSSAFGFRHWGGGGFQTRDREERRGGNFGRSEMRPGQSNSRQNRGAGQANAGRPGQSANGGVRPESGRSMPGIGPRQGGITNTRPGQQHLPQWWAQHRGLSPEQQAQAMRREPGFRNLPQGQQQRLLNRLRNFDARPPQVQQRMLDRMEMFERLSPERQQEVRGASQAFKHMPPEQKQTMIRAFQQLRQMPPADRERMLHSAYGQQFTPQERTVLGNLLSIEPYQPRVTQPYFGRP